MTTTRSIYKGILFVGLSAVVLAAAWSLAMLWLRGTLKRNIVAVLHDRFHGDVQLDDLQVGVFPRISATAQDIVLRRDGRTDVPPLITIQKFALSASVLGLLRRHVSAIHLQELQIHIPPRPPGAPPSSGIKPGKKIYFPLVIDEIVSDDALLEMLPGDAKHILRDFNIHRLVLHSFSFENSASFHATLTNPLPLGEIDSEGQFGPWQAEQPGDTAVAGTFRYSHVDFSSIRGLSGMMSSSGKYSGTLDQIDVEGDTEMPDFALSIAGNPLPLTTHYIAVVDGTDGNTYLKSVEARLGNSPISVNGEIVGIPGVKGKHIMLDATSRDARTEDLIGLAVKGGGPLKGSITLHTKIDLPPPTPGDIRDVAERLSLQGQFGISRARFTDPGVQSKLDSLSRAGQGEPKNEDIQDVISNVRGRFAVRQGTARFSGIEFEVPGAGVQLDGSYQMKSGDMDFHGHLIIDAKLSQTTTGAKSFVLKLFDPFFKKDGGGSSIPIKITGNRTHPNYGLDLGHKSDSKTKRVAH